MDLNDLSDLNLCTYCEGTGVYLSEFGPDICIRCVGKGTVQLVADTEPYPLNEP